MKSNAKPLTLYIVIDDKGKVYPESARLSYDGCIIAFVGEMIWQVKEKLNAYRAGVVWSMFEQSGWKVIEIEVPITTETI